MKADILFSLPIMQTLGWALFYSLWQGTLMTILLVGLLKLLPNNLANVRYTVSCVVLLLMLLLPIGTALNAKMSQPSQNEIESVLSAPVGLSSSNTISIDDAASRLQLWQHRLKRQIEPLLPWLILAWLIGVSVLSARLVGGWVQVRQLSRTKTSRVSHIWQAKTTELARRMRVSVPVRLLESTLVQVPAVVGRLRPVILLPATALTGVPAQQLEAIILHELAHIRRHDYLVNLLQTVVETLLFYHPAVWWVSRQIRVEREHACDDLAVSVCGDKLTYARALTSVEHLRKLTTPQLSMAVSGGEFLSRIRRLVEPSSPHSYQFGGPLAAITLLIGIVTLGATLSLSSSHSASASKLGEQESIVTSQPVTNVAKITNTKNEINSSVTPERIKVQDMQNIAGLKSATKPRLAARTETHDNIQKEIQGVETQTTNNEAVRQPMDSAKETSQNQDPATRSRNMKELRRKARQDAIQGINDSVMETSRQVNMMADRLMKKAIQDAIQTPVSKPKP